MSLLCKSALYWGFSLGHPAEDWEVSDSAGVIDNKDSKLARERKLVTLARMFHMVSKNMK